MPLTLFVPVVARPLPDSILPICGRSRHQGTSRRGV